MLHFMANVCLFKDNTIKEDEYNQALQEASYALKGNDMKKVVVSLEKLYDLKNDLEGQPTQRVQVKS